MEQKEDADPFLRDLRGKKVYIETYGCRYNFGDTAKLREILFHLNCTPASTVEDAEAIIVNTCTVVAPTERRMLRRLSHLRTRDLYVTGCLPAAQPEAIREMRSLKILPPAVIRNYYRSIGTVTPSPVAIVQIAQGCLGSCTYCITRKARGMLKSASVSEILSQISAFAGTGSVEIQLTAQDVSAWGRDQGLALPGLLRAISDLEGEFLLRVGMMNPSTVVDILDDLIDAFASKNLFRFIHLPVQSGSDSVLRKMGRDYVCGDFEQIVAAFRKAFPDITIATDMIVGFPGEGDDDFYQSLDLIRRLRFAKVNVTRFSRRPHTPAFSFRDTTDAKKKDRSRIMQACAEEIYHELNARYLGTILPFIVTEQVRNGSVVARSNNYLGIVINENLPIGFSGFAEIQRERMYYVTGRRIEQREKYPLSGN